MVAWLRFGALSRDRGADSSLSYRDPFIYPRLWLRPFFVLNVGTCYLVIQLTCLPRFLWHLPTRARSRSRTAMSARQTWDRTGSRFLALSDADHFDSTVTD